MLNEGILMKSRERPRRRAAREPRAARWRAIGGADTIGVRGHDGKFPAPNGIQPWHGRASGADRWEEQHTKGDRGDPISEAHSMIERSCYADLTIYLYVAMCMSTAQPSGAALSFLALLIL